MSKTTPPTSDKHYYLPYHGVFKSNDPNSRLRVVFNASARFKNSESLNDVLLNGPNLLPALSDIISNWRRYQIAITTDIEKMYRQIEIHPEDRDYQRIIWRPSSLYEYFDYKLNTITYGLCSAPYLANRVIKQLALDEANNFPLGASVLRHEIYMDDILTGADSVSSAKVLITQLINICTAGGFPLAKWSFNSSELSKIIPTPEPSKGPVDFHSDITHTILGLRWNPTEDFFYFHVTPTENQVPTKRIVLSETARLFDPLGWLAPVIIKAKILIQTLWLKGNDWDHPLDKDDFNLWHQFRNELIKLSEIKIPRWLMTTETTSLIELHGFADASERAYAAVIFVKISQNNEFKISLLQAKTRVAPLKKISLPRLELCAATLLTRLVVHVQATIKLKFNSINLWSDSTVTLAWLKGHPSKWTTYVTNRVSEIQQALPSAYWNHIPGYENLADCASRGLLPSELQNHPLWWSGPKWLRENNIEQPNLSNFEINSEELIAVKNEQRSHVFTITTLPKENELLLKFSTLLKLLRVTALCRRWLKGSSKGPLSWSEINKSLNFWILTTQRLWFSEEIKLLTEGKSLSRNNALSSLSPIISEIGILRIGGRLRNASLSRDQQHPIILPKRSNLTFLIIDHYHKKTLHGGPQLTLSTIRQRYWLMGGRASVKEHIKNCVPCVRWRGTSPHPQMSDLPQARVTVNRPFLNTGVDYAGPLMVKTSKGRGQRAHKAFLAIFICFSTRAIHIELVSDYTTAAFLAALRRFISRRGICSTISSDRGTNFVGADKELRKFFAESIKSKEFTQTIANQAIKWKFNPPSAPHFGGIWEAAVKATKHHIRWVIGEATLTFEEMYTLLTQIEACLNSRPLIPLSDDPEDLEALTPGHFLIGNALNAVPEPCLANVSDNRLSRWELVQKMRDHFWRRWSAEYLPTLNIRSKWRTTQPNLQVGMLCLIKGETTSPVQPVFKFFVRTFILVRTPNNNKNDEKIEKLQKEIKTYCSQNKKLKKQIKDKDGIVTDLMSLNMNLKKKVISEFTEISKQSKEIETQVINNFDELLPTLKHYLITQRNIDEVSVDVELQHIGTYISHKICELNRTVKCTFLKTKQKMIPSSCNSALDTIMEAQNIKDNLQNSHATCEIVQSSNKDLEEQDQRDESTSPFTESYSDNNNSNSDGSESNNSNNESNDSI
ncbi:uncharacterized protein [Cardiocondyla obscurior]